MDIDLLPAAVGAGAGLGAGIVNSYGGSWPYRNGAYKGLLLGAGFLGHILDWNDDLTYGLLCSGSYAVMQNIAPAVKAKSAKVIFEDRVAARPSRAVHAATCSSCAQHAAAPLALPSESGGAGRAVRRAVASDLEPAGII